VRLPRLRGAVCRTHVDKVSGLREIGTRTDGIETAANPVPGGDNCRHFCDQFDCRMHVGKMFALTFTGEKSPRPLTTVRRTSIGHAVFGDFASQ